MFSYRRIHLRLANKGYAFVKFGSSSMYVRMLISWDGLLIRSNLQLGRINYTTQETLLG